MKSVRSILAILIMIFCFVGNTFAGDIQKEFRDIRWGTSLATFVTAPSFYVERSVDGYFYYKNKKENVTLGNAKLSGIEYGITKGSKEFDHVYIYFKDINDTSYLKSLIDNLTGVKSVEGYNGGLFHGWKKGEITIVLSPVNQQLYIGWTEEVKQSSKGTF